MSKILGLEIHMWLFGWFYKIRSRFRVLMSMRLRTRGEILDKQKEWHRKMILAEQVNDKPAMIRFECYLKAIDWMIRNDKKNTD